MPGPWDEFDLEEVEQSPPARPRLARRTILDAVDVEGAADGTGSSTMGEVGSVLLGDEVDADAPIADVPTEGGASIPADKGPAQRPDFAVGARLEDAARARDTRGERIRARDEAAEHGGFMGAALDATGLGGEGSGRRTGERAQQFWDEFTVGTEDLGGRNPIDPIVGHDLRGEAPAAGFADVATLGNRIPALARSAATGQDYGDALSELDERTETARAQAPGTFSMGQALGTAPMLALPGPTGGMAARTAGGALQGAFLGGASALGHSRAEDGAGIAWDGLEGAGYGAAAGAIGGAAGRALEGPGATPQARAATMRALSEARDDALLSATTSAGRGQTAIREFERGATDPRRARTMAARALRETGAVPPVATIRGVSSGIDEAMTGTRGVLDDIARGMEGGGPTRAQVAEAMQRAAARDAGSPAGALAPGYSDVLEGSAGRLLGEVDEATGVGAQAGSRISYDDLVDMTRRLRQMGVGQGRAGAPVPVGREAAEEIDHIVRDVYDDAVEAQLGEGARRAYQGARGQYRALRTAQGNASTGEAAAAGNRALGLSEQLAILGGGMGGAHMAAGAPGSLGLLGAALAARGIRATEPTLRRTGADIAYQLARRHPQALSRAAPYAEAGARPLSAVVGMESASEPPTAQPVAPEAQSAEETDWSEFDLEYVEEEETP